MDTIKRVLISDEVDDVSKEILTSHGIEVVKNTKLTKEQLKEEIKNYDALVVRSATKVTSDVIEAAGSRLKLIGRAGTGVDNVDLPAATARGIVVMNTPDGNTLSAAELTCTHILSVSRHIVRGDKAVRGGGWKERSKLMGSELNGKTIAIIGLGRIGREVGNRMRAFGMKTIGYDPIITPEQSAQFQVEWFSLEELWPKADYITIHVPLVSATKHLISKEVLAKCKKGVRIINCSRGGVVDESALLASLESGHCAGAGLDVFEQEPPSYAELLAHPLVTLTPHLGASTAEAQCRVARDIARQIVDYTKGEKVVGVVSR